jgi:FkbM family methyltransferase
MTSRNPVTSALADAGRRTRAAVWEGVGAALRPFGLAIASSAVVDRGNRLSFRRALEHVKRMGWEPRTVVDVGVASGTWALYDAFASACILLVEPVAEAEPHLRAIAARYPRVEYVVAAAAARPGRIVLNVHPDTARSSAYWESDFVPGDITTRDVPAVTLDDLRGERRLEGPFLLKIDVQGGELDVLSGADEMLAETEYVILECCLFQFFDGAPLVAEVVSFMRARGFVIYDVASVHYRPFDGAMSTMDVVFVKETSRLRVAHRFQREPL